MTTSIGATQCTFVKGAVPILRDRVMTWFVPGVRGQFALDLGPNEGAFAVQAVLWDSKANVKTWRLALEALQGQVVTITDDWGDAWANCLIQSVPLPERWRIPLVGGPPGVECRGEVLVRGVVVA